ncbi:MAG: LutC/YkgG family protein [Chitinophagaceae bacterium]
MKVSPAKENILKRIRNALSQPVPLPFPLAEGTSSVFNNQKEELEIKFAEEFSKLQGKFVFCSDINEAVDNLISLAATRQWGKVFCKEKRLLELFSVQQLPFIQTGEEAWKEAEAGITLCESLIARTGSIVISSAQDSGRMVGIFSTVHIVFAFSSQLVFDVKDGLNQIKERYQNHLPSLISFQTGPSRTADIEKTLVVGVHGPKEVYLFFIDQDW